VFLRELSQLKIAKRAPATTVKNDQCGLFTPGLPDLIWLTVNVRNLDRIELMADRQTFLIFVYAERLLGNGQVLSGPAQAHRTFL
jgi:hypothetical protein